jgi:hypothetical protein
MTKTIIDAVAYQTILGDHRVKIKLERDDGSVGETVYNLFSGGTKEQADKLARELKGKPYELKPHGHTIIKEYQGKLILPNSVKEQLRKNETDVAIAPEVIDEALDLAARGKAMPATLHNPASLRKVNGNLKS